MRRTFMIAGMLAALLSVSSPSIASDTHPGTVLMGGIQQVTLLGTGGGGDEGVADQNCTKQDSESSETNDGILTEIEQYLKQIVDEAMQKLFNAITGDGRFQKAVAATLTLMIIVFGVLFMIGMVQLTFGQALVRLFKFAIVVGVTGAMGWSFFQQNVVCFFVGGGDEIIRWILEHTLGAGGGGGGGGGGYSGVCGAQEPVFGKLDELAQYVLKPETIAKVLAALTTGPYGLAMGGLMMIATIAFIKLLVKALETYAISYVARALLFGLAPIFIVFLLFERTKNYFTSWLNAVINFTLQPVLLFIMLAFMMDLIDQAAKDMLGVEVCWAEFQSTEGTGSKFQFWRFADSGQVDPSEYDWKGQVSCELGGGGDCEPFPIDIVDILAFVFLIFLASRFAEVIERITSQLSNIFISLDQSGRMEQFFDKQNKALGNFAGDIGRNITGGGKT